MKTAIVTGVAGQDGSFLAESLLCQGYEVHGLIRPSTRHEIDNLSLAQANPAFHRHDIDLLESESLSKLIRKVKPDEFYNLAACSFVPASWELPEYVSQVNAVAPLRMIEAIRAYSEDTRFYQAGSSEMFGHVRAEDLPLNERSYHHPRSPYGASKSFAHNLVRNYRESYGLHFTNGILFNHESERRDPRFVTRKITHWLAKWHKQGAGPLLMGNMDSQRDWGYSPDYVEAMQLMVRAKQADDWVVATGEKRTVRQFIEASFQAIGQEITWTGKGTKEIGEVNGKLAVKVDQALYRPAEVEVLEGNASKIRDSLNWRPKTTFTGMVEKMVSHDLALVKG